jgi:hypothetical protein
VVVGHALLPKCRMPHYPLAGGLPILLAAAQAPALVAALIVQVPLLGSTACTLALGRRISTMMASTSLRR